MSHLIQKLALDYSVHRTPKFNLDPMFGVNECRDKALKPIYSGLKRKNPSENIEKQASFLLRSKKPEPKTLADLAKMPKKAQNAMDSVDSLTSKLLNANADKTKLWQAATIKK